MAIVIAEALSPAVRWLERRIPRGAAVVLVYLALLAVLAGIGWFLVPALIDQASEAVNRAPAALDRLQSWLDARGYLSGNQIISSLSDQIGRLSGVLVSLSVTLVSTTLEALLVVFLSVYWLLSVPSLKRFVLSLLARKHHAQADVILHAMGRATGGYIRGVVFDGAITGALAFVGLTLIGVNYPIALGVLTFLGELFPVIGPVIVAVPVVLVALLQSPTMALLALLLYTAILQVEAHLLTPTIMHSQTDVPEALVLFALFAGGSVGGILGALVAIPLAGAARVLVLHLVVPWVRRWTGAADDDQPPAAPGSAGDDAAEATAEPTA